MFILSRYKFLAKMAARMQRVKVPRAKKVATKPSQPNYHEYIYKCHICLYGIFLFIIRKS